MTTLARNQSEQIKRNEQPTEQQKSERLVVIAEGSGRSKSRTAYAISPTNQFRFLSKLVGP